MGTSILTSTKKLLGIDESYTHFDADVIISINSCLATLNQIGIGPSEGFSIEDSSAEWEDFVGEDTRMNLVRSYVYMKTRVVFDPPATSFVLTALQDQIKEAEWRLNMFSEVENYAPRPVVSDNESIYEGF
jgi:hypothetical protein